MKLLVPILAIVLGVAFAVAIALRGAPDPDPAPGSTAGDADGAPVPGLVAGDEQIPVAPRDARDSDGDGRPDSVAQELFGGASASQTVPEAALTMPPDAAASTPSEASKGDNGFVGLRPQPAAHPIAPSLGSDHPEGTFEMAVDFTSYGAGIRRITLADYAQFVDPPTEGHPRVPYHLVDVTQGLAEGEAPAFYPYAARSITINGSTVPLDGVRWSAEPMTVVDGSQSVTYRLPIVDEAGELVVEIVRTWSLAPGSYDLSLAQRIDNKTHRPLDVTFEQYGQGDILTDLGAYLGDRRMFITGHFRDETPPKYSIYVDDSFVPRTHLLKEEYTLWPNPDVRADAKLAWLASENRYFALITHAPVPQGATQTAAVPELGELFPTVYSTPLDQRIDVAQADAVRVAVHLRGKQQTLAPGGSASLDLAIFAGPRDSDLLASSPFDVLHFDKLIRYELGCTWCTFQWLANGLLGYLKALHWLVRDWGMAIIILVLTVRIILHPITKKAQTNMMKMSRQMGMLQPEVAKLKEKYKDDPGSLNREMMKLYRERGINPANMLGCLPMLLQTPIWIALYAMLYFAIELRHEPAFYGIFQAISNDSWHFLQDLSVSDNFIRFVPPEQPAYRITWLPFIQPEFRSINILPLLMAVVFYFQMKITTPPPQNEQQKQQQAIMKFMPFIFPIFLYSAPSGLTLYICASTLAGIVDSYIVRKHVREQEEAGTLFDKKPIKPGSLRHKLQQRVELAQQMAMEKQAEMQKKQQGKPSFKKRK